MNIPLLPNTVHLYVQLAEWKSQTEKHCWLFMCYSSPAFHPCLGSRCKQGTTLTPRDHEILWKGWGNHTPSHNWLNAKEELSDTGIKDVELLSNRVCVVLLLWRGAAGFRWLTLAPLLLVRIRNLPECHDYLQGQGWLVPKHQYTHRFNELSEHFKWLNMYRIIYLGKNIYWHEIWLFGLRRLR